MTKRLNWSGSSLLLACFLELQQAGATLLLQSMVSRYVDFGSCCSRALEHKISKGLITPWHVGSAQTRDWTGAPCFARQTLNHWKTPWGIILRGKILPYTQVLVQLLSRVQLFATPSAAACQLPCPLLSPWVCSNSCTLSSSHVNQPWISHVIQPSHPLLSPSPLALNLSQHWGHFQWVSSSHQMEKVLELQLQHQPFQWIFRTDFL